MFHQATLDRKGSITITFLFLLIAVIGVGAMAVDFALISSARTDLRISSDLASRAAMVDYIENQDVQSARSAAKQIARLNGAIMSNLRLRNSDIIPGNSAPGLDGKYVFTPDVTPYNSFKVNANLDEGSRSGSLPLMFSSVHKRETVDLTETSTATETYLDIVLVLDRSGSMAFDLTGTQWSYPSGNSWQIDYFVAPQAESRWESLEGAIGVFLDEMEAKVKKEQVALVTYSSDYETYSSYWDETFTSDEVSVDQTFTYDYDEILNAVLDIGSEPVIGATAISSGIDEAITLLNNSSRAAYAEKVIVLLTDGDWNTGYDPVVAAETAAANKIVIHTVAFGSGAGASVMQEVAEVSGGVAFNAPGDAELSEAFRDIARSIGLTYTE